MDQLRAHIATFSRAQSRQKSDTSDKQSVKELQRLLEQSEKRRDDEILALKRR